MAQIHTGNLPALTVVDGQPTCTSVDVAHNFDKRHDAVLRDIRNLRNQLAPDRLHNFVEVIVEYKNGKGGLQQAPAYRLTRDGFTLLAMGYTGKKALAFKLAYIDAFNAMAEELARQAQARRAKLPMETAYGLPAFTPHLTTYSMRRVNQVANSLGGGGGQYLEAFRAYVLGRVHHALKSDRVYEEGWFEEVLSECSVDDMMRRDLGMPTWDGT